MPGHGSFKATPNQQTKPSAAARRFVGVRQLRSGRWVAEIKDSSRQVQLWLGTFDTPEAAARAYDEAARALRRENARTNFTFNASSPPEDASSGNCGFFVDSDPCPALASLRAALSKNVQGLMAGRTDDGKSSKARMSDQSTFASVFHRSSCSFHQSIGKAVQPSFIVPAQTSEEPPTSGSPELVAVDGLVDGLRIPQQYGFDEEPTLWRFDHDEVGMERERERELITGSKTCKVSSSVVVPSTFIASSEPFGETQLGSMSL